MTICRRYMQLRGGWRRYNARYAACRVPPEYLRMRKQVLGLLWLFTIQPEATKNKEQSQL